MNKATASRTTAAYSKASSKPPVAPVLFGKLAEKQKIAFTLSGIF